ncbi:MAG: UDP-N-acetylglucosamine--N-acetylmuramyl-(pentapeptide) pyrophosphoryl-undecaprenol N-acetylglucosamine transferase [Candidatus Omnitrophica bacterium]|nr:UDP-N-acetylglucosamine--N-acetylmuramyl-(pentapeptide) pyrophosphoryl-undecaprenol N-acetylglucosamine transferase [Candidatus Omnitrophota bacterium]
MCRKAGAARRRADEVRVLAAAGGSGGHCYPAIAFLQACRKRHPDWTLTLAVDRGVKTLGLEVEAAAAHSIREVESAGFAGLKSLLDFRFWGKLIRGSRQAKALLKSAAPDLVIGFGGYGSFPVVWEAESAGVPVILHEQNAVMGLANRVLAIRAKKLAVSLPLKRLPSGARREQVIQTGFPLRSTLRRLDAAAVRGRFGLDPAKKTLLVFGGSQGSKFINGLMDTLIKDHGDVLKANWQILHLTGRASSDALEGHDTVTGPFRRWTYSREMDALYTAADLVACRAGSATLHELSYYGKPSILIPYPYAHGHQVENARVLADGGAAWLSEEKNTTPASFAAILNEAAADASKLVRMAQRSSGLLKTDGASALVDLAECLAAR